MSPLEMGFSAGTCPGFWGGCSPSPGGTGRPLSWNAWLLKAPHPHPRETTAARGGKRLWGLEPGAGGGGSEQGQGPRRRVSADSTSLCSLAAGHCPSPGIPVGSVRTGSRFGLGDKVNYRCSSNLVLTGSAERECQDSGVWSGTEPICRRE